MNHVLNEGEYRLENIAARRDDLVMISGCSGGGKSTLLEELSRRGFATCEEPGRQVVREQLFIYGEALPWANLPLFVELTISRSINFMTEAACRGGRTFFDRGIVDQIAGLEQAGHIVPPVYLRAAERCAITGRSSCCHHGRKSTGTTPSDAMGWRRPSKRFDTSKTPIGALVMNLSRCPGPVSGRGRTSFSRRLRNKSRAEVGRRLLAGFGAFRMLALALSPTPVNLNKWFTLRRSC